MKPYDGGRCPCACGRPGCAGGWSRASESYRTRMVRQSRNDAGRNGMEWTDAELALALDRRLTKREAAQILGRTFYAVDTVRKDRPRWLPPAPLPSISDLISRLPSKESV